MFNNILSSIGGFMAQLRLPTMLGQGILAAVEFLLTGGKFIIDLFTKAFGFLSYRK